MNFIFSGYKNTSHIILITIRCSLQFFFEFNFFIKVTDTPGFSKLSKEEFIKELSKSFVLSCPGPHVVIIVLRCDRPFTEVSQYKQLSRNFLWGDLSVCLSNTSSKADMHIFIKLKTFKNFKSHMNLFSIA